MDKKEKILNEKLLALSKSKFRSSFYLNEKMKSYIKTKGFNEIKNHTIEFVNKKIGSAYPVNDGKQTPMKGHPTFIAMHACATCCRGCLKKWHNIPKSRELTLNEKNYIVSILLMWMKKELKK